MNISISGLGKCFPEDFENNVIPYKKYMPKSVRRTAGELAKMFYIAASFALEDASIQDISASAIPIITASAMGELNSCIELVKQIYESKGELISPTLVQNTVANAPAGILSIGFSNKNRAIAFSNGFLSLDIAIDYAIGLFFTSDVSDVLIVAGESPSENLQNLSQKEVNLSEATTEGAIAFILSKIPLKQNKQTKKNYGSIINSCVFALQENYSLTRQTLETYGFFINDDTQIIVSEIGKRRFKDMDVLAKNLSVERNKIKYKFNDLISPYTEFYELLTDTNNENNNEEILLLKTEFNEISALQMKLEAK